MDDTQIPLPRRQALRTMGGMIGPLLAGCTSRSGQEHGTQEPTNKVNIITDYNNEVWMQLWRKKLIPEFKSKLNTDVIIESTYNPGFPIQRIKSLLEDGSSAEAATGELQETDDLLLKDQLSPLTESVSSLIEKNGRLVGLPMKLQGEIYTIPHGKWSPTIHYRRDILERLGLSPPRTTEQFLHNAKVIDESDKVDMRGCFPPTKAKIFSPGDGWLLPFLNTFGGHPWRWKSQENEEAEVWFPKDRVKAALEYSREIAQYAPNPESVEQGGGWVNQIAGQMLFINAVGAFGAVNTGNESLVQKTQVVPVPVNSESSSDFRGSPGFDGFIAFSKSNNVSELRHCLEYMYGKKERTARYYRAEPHMIPAYRDVLDIERYTDMKIFEQYPHLLDLNQHVSEKIIGIESASADTVVTPATIYAEKFNILDTLLREVVAENRSILPAINDAHAKLEDRLNEGKKLEASN